MNPAKQSVNLKDVAEFLSISCSTVSRAIRDDPRISAAVRQRVKETARMLGYQRDARLGELMTHLRRGRQPTFQGSLAWVCDHDPNDADSRIVHEFYKGCATKRAESLGYRVEFFPASGPENARSITRVLRARGIRGIALHVMEDFRVSDWDIEWDKFAVVHTGALQAELQVDTVDADDVGNNLEMLTILAEKGYRRIGVATSLVVERAIGFSLSGARRRFELARPGHPAFPEFFMEEVEEGKRGKAFREWLKRHEVDCVVSQVAVEELTGGKMPAGVGIAYQGVAPSSRLSGMYQNDEEIAKLVVETLANSVEQGRFGLPEIPRQILLKGRWHQGHTCR